MSDKNFFINKYKEIQNKKKDDYIKSDGLTTNTNKENKELKNKILFQKIPEERNNLHISKKRLAALLLILSGIKKSTKILKNFSKEEVIKAISEILKIEKITEQELFEVEKNFGNLKISDLSQYKGGKEFAIQLLQQTFGMNEGSLLFLECIEKNNDKALSFLESLPTEKIYEFISNESTTIIALILSLLDPKISSKILTFFPKDKLSEIVKKLSCKIEVNSDAFDIIISKLKDKFEEYKKDNSNTLNISGKKKLIEILKFSDPEKAKNIIQEIKKEDQELANELEENIFTFDDILLLKKEDLEKALKNYKDKEIALILKGASDEIKKTFLNCISKRRKDMIEKEIEYLDKVTKAEVMEKRKKFIEHLKDMEKRNEIVLTPDKEIYIT